MTTSLVALARDGENIVGTSGAMRRVLDQVALASSTGTPVTLRGEPGTGRAYLARAIHRGSAWASHAFVEVACDASHDESLRVALFGGQSKGPGSSGTQAGLRLRGGTFFLREVADLTLESQGRLIRTLAQEAFNRDLQGSGARIRLLATTSADLEDAVGRGRFRPDLYHRLTVMTIVVPALRDRKGDVPALTDEFLRRFGAVHGKTVRQVSARAMDLLLRYPWPGNVQELANAIERAVVLCEDATVHAHHLPQAVKQTEDGGVAPFSLEESVGAYERELVQDALRSARGVRSKAARLLKTTDRVLNYKIRKYGIDYRRFKP